MEAILKVEDINVYYGSIHAIKGVSFEVNEGETVTLIGANGAGKSTTLMTICGINRPRKGEILWTGEPIHELPPHEIVRLGISQVPEGRLIFPDLSVRENLDLGAFLRNDVQGIKEDMDYVFDLFPILAQRRKQTGGTLPPVCLRCCLGCCFIACRQSRRCPRAAFPPRPPSAAH